MEVSLNRILSIKFKNFKCFDNSRYYEIRFKEDSPLCILSGPNGFGKTTLFDALKLLFMSSITRFNTDIEHASKNSNANILLNDGEAGSIIRQV